jgi:uncharacterized protein
MKTICIYHHKDLDGKASAAIVKLKYPESVFMGWDYGDPIPEIEKGFDIIIVDLCLAEKSNKVDIFEPMLEIAEKANSFLWIDHHKSNIQKWIECKDPRKEKIEFYGREGNGACELTWEYFFNLEPLPLMIKLLGEYDTWRIQDTVRWEKVVLPFQFGMRVTHTSVDDVFNLLQSECRKCPNCGSYELIWAEFKTNKYICKSCGHFSFQTKSSKTIDDIVHDGKVVLSYQGRQNTNLMRYNSYEVEFDGLRAIVANSNLFNSQVFNGFYDESKHDIMICWLFTGKLFKYSLYTTKDEIDVSEIAVRHGGGGHKGAAGFENEKYIL